jgi:hypothetical protein
MEARVRVRVLLLATLALAGCGSPAPAPGHEEGPAAKVAALLPRLSSELAALRGAALLRPVEVRAVPPGAFRAWLARDLDRSLPPERARREARLLAALGLVAPGRDLRAAFAEDEAALGRAAYDPEQGRLLVVDAPGRDPDRDLEGLVLHELVHALADQRHDLRRWFARLDDPATSDDEALAARCLLEGEALLVQQRAVYGRDLADRRARDLAARPPARDWVEETVLAPYRVGPAAVLARVEAGGWPAVDALLDDPPRSTAELLHPGRPRPRAVEAPDLLPALGPGWSRRLEETLGELRLRLWLSLLGLGERRDLCAGWDGDRIALFDRDGAAWPAFAWTLAWRTEAAAAAFADLLLATQRRGPPPLARARVERRGDVVSVTSAPE